jgi:hypothetical protein
VVADTVRAGLGVEDRDGGIVGVPVIATSAVAVGLAAAVLVGSGAPVGDNDGVAVPLARVAVEIGIAVAVAPDCAVRITVDPAAGTAAWIGAAAGRPGVAAVAPAAPVDKLRVKKDAAQTRPTREPNQARRDSARGMPNRRETANPSVRSGPWADRRRARQRRRIEQGAV